MSLYTDRGSYDFRTTRGAQAQRYAGSEAGGMAMRICAPVLSTAGPELPPTNRQPPALSLKHCRPQAERLRRDAADPKLHALDLDLDEDRIRPVCFGGKVDVIGGLPTAARLGLGPRAARLCQST